jgi:hypothetical protein
MREGARVFKESAEPRARAKAGYRHSTISNCEVGAGYNSLRDAQAERRSRFEIKGKFENDGLLNGKLGWLDSLKYFIDVNSQSAKHRRVTRGIARQLRLWCAPSKPIFDLPSAMNTSTRSAMK